MKQTIKLRESELRRMISESIRRVLNEGIGPLGSLKRIHETPNVVVKETTKYRGRDPKGVNYNIYVDGAKMFSASMKDSEYDSWNGGRYQQRGTFGRIVVYYQNYDNGRRLTNDIAFRQQIGIGKTSELNFQKAEENVKQISAWTRCHYNNGFAVLENTSDNDMFTLESAPYIIRKYVEGLITPMQQNKVKSTDKVTFEDVFSGKKTTMTVQEAYKYAVSVYKEICQMGYSDLVMNPKAYGDIEDCLSEYSYAWQRIEQENYEPEDWFERWEHGDFDEY